METVPEQETIQKKGMEIFRRMAAEPPAIFDKRHWIGELMNLAMNDPDFKVQMFRFIDVFPTLNTTELVARHLQEYFLAEEFHLPWIIKKFLAGASSHLTAGTTAALLSKNITSVARTFIAGESPAASLKALKHIWDGGRTFSVDILGEAALSEKEARQYLERYLDLIDFLAPALAGWPSPAPEREPSFPRLNVSVKISSLYSRIGPLNYEDSVEQVKERLRDIFRKARAAGGRPGSERRMHPRPTGKTGDEAILRVRFIYPPMPYLA